MPGGKRIIFASNYGDPKGREFDLWAIDVAGHAPGTDHRRARVRRLPAVLPRRQAAGVRLEPRDARRASTTPTCSSPTGSRMTPSPAAATRRTRPPIGSCATCAGWPIPLVKGAASAPPGSRRRARTSRSASSCCDLEPAGDDGGYRQAFPVRTGLKVEPGDRRCASTGTPVARDAFQPLGFSGDAERRSGRWCSPGYGLVDKELGLDDYAGRRRARQDRRRAPLRPRARGAVDARAPAARRRPAPEGVARARARRARAAGRRPAGPPEGRARRLEAAGGAAAVAAAARAATATRAFRC